jgi:hypothetical protein
LTCSLPRKLGKVTRGRLYSFLPVIYGDVAALILGESARYAGETRSFYQELRYARKLVTRDQAAV